MNNMRDVVTIQDVQDMLGVCYNKAAQIIRDVKHTHDRLHLAGRVHVLDWSKHFDLDPMVVYSILDKRYEEK